MSLKRNKPIIIELFGLPGSGKSFLAQELAKDKEVDLIPWKTGKWEGLVASLENPFRLAVWLCFISLETLSSKTFSLFRYKLSLLFNTFARFKKAKASKNKIAIIDEGFFQRFLSFSEEKKSQEMVYRIIKNNLNKSRVLIVEAKEPDFGRYNKDHKRTQIRESYLNQWKVIMNLNYKILKTILRNEISNLYVGPQTTAEDILRKIK